jgi:hypothetical protein
VRRIVMACRPCHFGTRIIEAPGPSLSPRLGPFFGDCHSWKTIENWLWCFTRAAVSQHIQLMVSIITRKTFGQVQFKPRKRGG